MIRKLRLKKHEDLYERFGDSKNKVYAHLKSLGYYLPPKNCPAVDREYLLGVKDQTILAQTEKNVRKYPYPLKCTKEQAFCLLQSISDDPLGFDITRLPPKQWMLDMAFTLDPENITFVTQSQSLHLGTIAPNPVQWEITLKNTLENTRPPLATEYNHLRRQSYKDAIKTRLKRLVRKYPFCTVDLNNILLN